MESNSQSQTVIEYRWECASCGETGTDGVPECPECGSRELDDVSEESIVCPDCEDSDTHVDGELRLHCLNDDCGEINDAYSQQYNPADEIEVDVRPFWQRQTGREDRYGVDRLYTRIHGDGASAFIGVEGLTVEFFSGPIQHTEPEITRAESPEEAAAAIENAMDEFNDLHQADYTGKEEA